MNTARSLFPAFLVSCGVACSTPVFAQQAAGGAYPDKLATIIVANVASGTMGLEARIYALKLGEVFGKPFVVDYKAGAGGAIGAAHVAKAAPDGHTLLFASTSFSVIPAFGDDIGYDPVKSFAPVSLMSLRPSVLIANTAFAPRNMKEYLEYARANPGKINFGTSGNGGSPHLAGAWMHSVSNTEVTFVHYKGSGAVMPDLLSGRVHVYPAVLVAAMPLIRAGKVRAIAMLGPERSSLLPEVATVAEGGIENFNVSSWAGFMTTAGTPGAIVGRLSSELATIAKAPEVAKVMEAGTVMVGSSPAQFAQLITGEVTRWRELVKKYGIKQD